jgi:hypothetical protein
MNAWPFSMFSTGWLWPLKHRDARKYVKDKRRFFKILWVNQVSSFFFFFFRYASTIIVDQYWCFWRSVRSRENDGEQRWGTDWGTMGDGGGELSFTSASIVLLVLHNNFFSQVTLITSFPISSESALVVWILVYTFVFTIANSFSYLFWQECNWSLPDVLN